MSGYQPTYVPGQRSGSGNVSGQAPSFKTNVNRNKTKRWVNAKQVSYDGDDWGSSEEDDVDEQPPPMPSLGPPSQAAEGQQYPHVETRTGFPAVVNSPPQFKGQPGASEGAPPSGGNVTSPRDEQGRPVPFIRPADIYKRMAEERERERQRTGETPSGSPAPANNTQPPVTAVSQPEVPEPEQQNIPQEVTKPSNSPDTEKTPGISQIPPLGSGADTQDSSTTPTQAKTTPASTETGLQHNPSLGLRSVVHQAFDTPETPSTTTGTFSRSNSDSTSIISPIIRSNQHSVHENRAPDADQTPTIKEEPSEATSPAEPVPGFKPGHRRSMTPPTSGMAPVGHPILTTPIQAPRSEWGDMAGSGSMEPGSKTAPVGGPDAADHSSQSAGTFGHQSSNIEPPKDDHDADRQKKRDSIPPLAIRTASGGDRTDEPPSISAPRNFSPSSGETSSPNERLRREIMQSLSPSPGASASPHERESSTGAPNGEEPEDNATTPIQQQPSATSPAAPIVPSQVESVAPSDAKQDGEENVQRQSYQLQKRFSWEEDSSDEEAATPQRKPEVEAPQDTRSSSPELKDPSEPSATGRSSLSENARGQLVVPAKSAELDEPSAQSPIVLQDNISDRGEAGPRSSVDAPELKVEEPVEQQAVKPLPLPQDPNLPGFREILAIKLPQDKVKKFDETREQFAFMDTGLDAWLIQTSESIPEHSDLVELNGRLPAATAAMLQKSATSRTKFPKISGLGSLSLQTSHQDGSTSSPSHARTPSGMQLNSQQMQARGKDLLHSAGVLSGKAGGAAKGLFAKGRSRFRNSGSGEKAFSLRFPSGSSVRVASPSAEAGGEPGPAASFEELPPEPPAKDRDPPRKLELNLDQTPLNGDFGFDIDDSGTREVVRDVQPESPEDSKPPPPPKDDLPTPHAPPEKPSVKLVTPTASDKRSPSNAETSDGEGLFDTSVSFMPAAHNIKDSSPVSVDQPPPPPPKDEVRSSPLGVLGNLPSPPLEGSRAPPLAEVVAERPATPPEDVYQAAEGEIPVRKPAPFPKDACSSPLSDIQEEQFGSSPTRTDYIHARDGFRQEEPTAPADKLGVSTHCEDRDELPPVPPKNSYASHEKNIQESQLNPQKTVIRPSTPGGDDPPAPPSKTDDISVRSPRQPSLVDSELDHLDTATPLIEHARSVTFEGSRASLIHSGSDQGVAKARETLESKKSALNNAEESQSGIDKIVSPNNHPQGHISPILEHAQSSAGSAEKSASETRPVPDPQQSPTDHKFNTQATDYPNTEANDVCATDQAYPHESHSQASTRDSIGIVGGQLKPLPLIPSFLDDSNDRRSQSVDTDHHTLDSQASIYPPMPDTPSSQQQHQHQRASSTHKSPVQEYFGPDNATIASSTSSTKQPIREFYGPGTSSSSESPQPHQTHKPRPSFGLFPRPATFQFGQDRQGDKSHVRSSSLVAGKSWNSRLPSLKLDTSLANRRSKTEVEPPRVEYSALNPLSSTQSPTTKKRLSNRFFRHSSPVTGDGQTRRRGSFSKITNLLSRPDQNEQSRDNHGAQQSTSQHAWHVGQPHEYTPMYNRPPLQTSQTMPVNTNRASRYYLAASPLSSPADGDGGYVPFVENRWPSRRPENLTPNSALTPGWFGNNHRNMAYPSSPASGSHTQPGPRTGDLRMRSRSPRSRVLNQEREPVSTTNETDVANNLGTFSAVRPTRRVGDQETPWNITLPEDEEREHKRALKELNQSPPGVTAAQFPVSAQGVTPQTDLPVAKPVSSSPEDVENTGSGTVRPSVDVAHGDGSENVATPPTSQDAKAGDNPAANTDHRHPDAPELRGSKVTGDNSSEEIIMSSTSYPGQEWMPSFDTWD